MGPNISLKRTNQSLRDRCGRLAPTLGIMTTLLALAAATLAPALLMALWYLYGQFAVFASSDPYIWVRTANFLTLCVTVSALHVVLLGAPAYALLRWKKLVSWWSTLATGFVLATLPVSLITWPLRFPELKTTASFNGVSTIVEGVPTAAGWMQYFEGVLFFGACGALSGLAFWLVWRRGTQKLYSQPSQ
jgi:hypothetical protein